MATWSSGAFGNDGAAQWALALKVTDDFAAIEYVLDGSFDEGHFMYGACLRGVAAVAVLAEFLKYCQDPVGAAVAARLDAMNGRDVLDGDGLGSTFARIYDVAEHINAWVRARLEAADLPTTKLLSRAAYFIEAVLADPDERSRAMDDAFVDEWLEAYRIEGAFQARTAASASSSGPTQYQASNVSARIHHSTRGPSSSCVQDRMTLAVMRIACGASYFRKKRGMPTMIWRYARTRVQVVNPVLMLEV